ncbi:hypothetical protein OG946_20225 [Streptomyces sp. NBC_01808]|uniref:hypothetical protein n=1 Tax=Streptomyces sp. NBC_01808 TaxID=2975947 RepID=UPI002DD9E445|nr:hypothetical protein [Streptomyces sp. NBC_01808]WSA39483.1 hypothetical protein OG946_20225 [Streptomyces sp. NBC_01808]
MADTNPTQRPAPAPPAVGRSLSVRVNTEDMRDDLAVVMRAHGDAAEPTRLALRLLADAYRRAWTYDDVPDGTAPHIIAMRYALPDGTPETMPDPRHTRYPHVRDTPAPYDAPA